MSRLLRIEGLRKRFEPMQLFDIDVLEIEAGMAYVLTGANGSGKTTLLRVLAGLEPAEASTVVFDGHSCLLRPYSRLMREHVVYVHQHPVMFSTSVPANIAYGLRARGVPAAEARRIVAEAMDWAGIGHLWNSSPHTLSGGEKQRVALARARVLRPRLLLLDEPTANLDGPAREQVLNLIPDIVRSGASTVVACHDRDLIALPGVRRLKLRNGCLEERGAAGKGRLRLVKGRP